MSETIRSDPWPLLLLGPILRRVTRDEVHVFIATSSEVSDARLLISSGRIRADAQTPSNHVATSSPTMLRQIGEHLFVGLLAAKLPGDLAEPADGLFSYDIKLTVGTAPYTLLELGLLGGSEDGSGDQLLRYYDRLLFEAPLGYQPGYLPNFRLPPTDIAELRIAHGSCRKPHGGDEHEPDALAILDRVIEASLAPTKSEDLPDSNQERPHQLILTGDQIYADDVAAALLVTLRDTGDALLGWSEEVPAITLINRCLLHPGWRTRLLSVAGVKDIPPHGETDYPANHLLRFGEWCAMYLFAWSDALWPRDEEGNYTLLKSPPRVPVTEVDEFIGYVEMIPGMQVIPPAYTKWVTLATYLDKFQEHLDEVWKETRPKAIGYASTVRFVRRLLANVPTYTMFDDHEITDDWFLNQRVVNRQTGQEVGVFAASNPEWSKIGPRMLRNGLSAYAIFQHWGNVPEDFAPGSHGEQLLDLWEAARNDPPTLAEDDPSAADRLLGITAAIEGETKIGATRAEFERMRWDYAIRFPAHRLVVLDTRTWRHYPDRTPFEWADLEDLSTRPSSGDDGSQYIRDAALAWRQAGQQAGSAAMQAWAEIVQGCADITAAGSVGELRARLDAIGAATRILVRSLVPNIPARGAFEAEIAAWRSSTVPGVSTLGEGLWTGVNFLERVSRVQLVPQHQPLRLAFARLAEYLQAWASGSYFGMAGAAQRFMRDANEGLWELFSDVSSMDAKATLALTLHAVGGQVEELFASLGVDQMSKKFFRDGSTRLGAALISEQALAFQLTDALADTGTSETPTVLLSPAPIFGHKLAELAQRAQLIRATMQGLPAAEVWEYEAWSVNIPAMHALFEAGQQMRRCVVLSGDVHYANSSVNDVLLAISDPVEAMSFTIEGRYVQLTSSSARNADGQTRGLGLLDDILYDADDRVNQLQADYWISFLSGGEDGEPSVGGYYKEVAIEKLGGLVDRALHLGGHAAHYYFHQHELVLDLWKNRPSLAQIAAMTKAVVTAPINTGSAWISEAAWKFYASLDFMVRFADDPLFATFGEFLYAKDIIREELLRFYDDLGLDPYAGLQVVSSVLHDHRENRLGTYAAAGQRFAKYPQDSDILGFAQIQELRTVGSANIGLISFEVEGDAIHGVRHELLWYPRPELDKDKHKKVIELPLPRTDWIGTLHRAAFDVNEVEHDRGKPIG